MLVLYRGAHTLQNDSRTKHTLCQIDVSKAWTCDGRTEFQPEAIDAGIQVRVVSLHPLHTTQRKTHTTPPTQQLATVAFRQLANGGFVTGLPNPPCNVTNFNVPQANISAACSRTVPQGKVVIVQYRPVLGCGANAQVGSNVLVLRNSSEVQYRNHNIGTWSNIPSNTPSFSSPAGAAVLPTVPASPAGAVVAVSPNLVPPVVSSPAPVTPTITPPVAPAVLPSCPNGRYCFQ